MGFSQAPRRPYEQCGGDRLDGTLQLHGAPSGASHCGSKPPTSSRKAGGRERRLARGGRRARLSLEELLFPTRPAQQLDTALSYKYQKLRMYMSKEPLMSADKSHEADTDIQIIPDVPLNDGDLELSIAPDPETTPEVVPEAGRRASGNDKPNGASLRELFACRFLDLRSCFGSSRRTLGSNSTRAS